MPKLEFNIVIIGSGNMANALGNLFCKKHKIVQIISTNKITGNLLANKLKTVYHSSLKEINTQADFYFLCVPDDEIKGLSKKIKHVNGIVVHHSGSKPMNEIAAGKTKAVLYPFLSINKKTELNTKNVTVFYQANHKASDFLMHKLFSGYKFSFTAIDDKNRAKLHLAAVLVNNFTNHLYLQAQNLTSQISGANDLLIKLAEQAMVNFKQNKLKENQTGPARRKDKTTQKNHLAQLKSNKELTKVYLSLTQAISKTYNHE